jgi:predicted Fe-Mo cluster-binding NifX family protein
MKFAIPTNNKKLCLHFGHCEVFTFIEADEATKAILNKEEITPPPHEPGILPPWVAEHGATVILAGGMGMRAQQLFVEQGIKVLVGASELDPEKLVIDYLNGTLTTGVNACDH